VTVFVGPNNSGKSKVLSEIDLLCRTGKTNSSAVILDSLDFEKLTDTEAEEFLGALLRPPNEGENVPKDHVVVQGRQGRYNLGREHLKRTLAEPTTDLVIFCRFLLSHFVIWLGGPNRIGLVDMQPAGDLTDPGHAPLQVLFSDDAKRHEVRRIVYKAFKRYFVIDPTRLGNLRIRLSQRPPLDPTEERGVHQEAVQFHTDAPMIDTFSDGVKAFIGIVIELLAGDPRIVLIDEPEAFLHPSLASQLGNAVAQAAMSSGKRVFASTHSPAFLMGCIQSGAPVNIVRLTYRDGAATARLLPSDQLLELMRNPLLRSTGVLSGLFYESVVVTESDADRAFYQEVNDRLLRFAPELGIPNCLFLNAQNKQTVHTILRPLRQLGIPAAGIVDVDILKDGGTVWTKLLSSANMPELSHGSLATLRAAVKSAMDGTGKDMKRHGGVGILPDDQRPAALDLFSQLAKYGVFVVPGGELESWLRDLGVKGHGTDWLINIFEKMGADPLTADYVKPAQADVWTFIREVRGWLLDPARQGIPN